MTGSYRTYWNRFDIPGETVDLADKALCAYQEVLEQFKQNCDATGLLMNRAATGLSTLAQSKVWNHNRCSTWSKFTDKRTKMTHLEKFLD